MPDKAPITASEMSYRRPASKRAVFPKDFNYVRSLLFAVVFIIAIGVPLLHAQPEGASLQQARQLIADGDLAGARTLLEAAIKADLHASEAHFLLGLVSFRQHDAKQSLAEYTLGAGGRRPTASEFRIIGADYVLLKDFADADKWFTQATQEDPNEASGWYLLGRAKYSEGKYAESLACFQHVLAITNTDPWTAVKAQDNMGLSYQALNQLPEAKAAFEKAIALQRNSELRSGAPYLDFGELLLQEGQPEKAVEFLRKAVLLSPGNPKAHEQLGVALQQTDELPGARVEFEKAVKLAPNASPLHFELGQVYRHLGMKEEATRELNLCSQLTATHSSAEVPNFDGGPDSGEQLHPPAAPPPQSKSN